MNPFRRVWPREIALYLSALVLLAHALIGMAHAAHVGTTADPAFCAAEHEPGAPAKATAPVCPLCQLPSFAAPAPASVALAAPVAWAAIVYPRRDPVVAAPHPALPAPPRGPPSPV